jgi:hypothetical protein
MGETVSNFILDTGFPGLPSVPPEEHHNTSRKPRQHYFYIASILPIAILLNLYTLTNGTDAK